MNTGYSYTHPRLPRADLLHLVTSRCGECTFLYSQTMNALSLTQLGKSRPTLAPEGRAFGPKAEVRWQRQAEEADFFVVLTLSETPLELEEGWQSETFEVSDPLDVYLMGIWLPQEEAWLEVRIPHPLDYPLPVPEQMARPIARAVEYSRSGIVRYLRLKGLDSRPLEEVQG